MVRGIVILTLLPFLLAADEVSLVPVGDTWRYFKGVHEPSSPLEAWRQVSFDDSQWLTGVSGFSHGYSPYDEATILADMPGNYSSVFLRKTFIAEAPGSAKWLILRVDYDHGFVAYLNGQEIGRRDLPGEPGSPVPFDTLGASHSRGLAEEIDIIPFIPLLVPGENVLAVQVHNSAIGNSQFSFVAELLSNFNRGPFVQNASTNGIQVIWKTPFPSDSLVQYGTDRSLSERFFDPALVTNHVVALQNLSSDEQYFYQITSSAAGQSASSAIHAFRTLKSKGDLTFVVVGETGNGSIAQYQMAKVIEKATPDLVLHAGDAVHPKFTAGRADLKFLSVYRTHMTTTPYYLAVGDHDWFEEGRDFFDAFFLPTNSVTGTENFYSFDHGDAHFTVLFWPFSGALKPGDLQYHWLTNDLAASTKPWKFLVFHVPVRTSGPHQNDDSDANGILDRLEAEQLILPAAKQYGVQLIFTSHDHDYERFNPMSGVHLITTGGGGAFLSPLVERDRASSQFWSRYHCVKVTIEGDSLLLQALDSGGQVFDSMVIQRALPPARVYQATWYSPVVEPAASNDGDGNINGQSYTLIGNRIPTLPGQFSNLGQVSVDNDSINLYIGFERVMIYPDNNIFLFIESPRRVGVTTLAGLGDGVIDPDQEGVDGLDFLENLSFTNFAPSVAVLAGDELGDGQLRSFKRRDLGLNIGQGVFHLDANFSDVPHTQMQQFNHLVQTGAVFDEENADFIEVAIPLTELGDLQEGDLIRIGAVVAGELVDTQEQFRQLDSGFLGASFIEYSPNRFRLEGVSVQLASDPDPDFDGLVTAYENLLGTDPFKSDTDADGLPDGWEAQHGLDPLSTTGDDGAMGDPDEDGLPNAEEYTFGTDPLDPDTDGDGLQDGWETAYGLNPLRSIGNDAGTGDPDGDGSTNAQEQLAGTDPQDPQSVLRLRIFPLNSHKRLITWEAVLGKTYQLEFSDSPLGPFNIIAESIFPRVALSPFESYVDDLSSQVPGPLGRFYRVRLVL